MRHFSLKVGKKLNYLSKKTMKENFDQKSSFLTTPLEIIMEPELRYNL